MDKILSLLIVGTVLSIKIFLATHVFKMFFYEILKIRTREEISTLKISFSITVWIIFMFSILKQLNV